MDNRNAGAGAATDVVRPGVCDAEGTVVEDGVVELKPGMEVAGWKLVRPLKNSKTGAWLVQCVRCDRLDYRLADHLRIGEPPRCGGGRCRKGRYHAGQDQKRRVAARNGQKLSDLEAWAFENCDRNVDAQRIVSRMIKRETAKMAEERRRSHEARMKRGEWRHYNPSSRPSESPQYSLVETGDDH